MLQVRFHGRGGQGVVTAAELLASAAFSEGKHAQAFPSFGSERMGAPVMSFCRIDEAEIRTHEPVSEPDALIIQDPTLLHQAELFAGLGHKGYMLINSTHGFDELGLDDGWKVPVDAAPTGKRVLVVGAGRPACQPPITSPAWVTRSAGSTSRPRCSRRAAACLAATASAATTATASARTTP